MLAMHVGNKHKNETIKQTMQFKFPECDTCWSALTSFGHFNVIFDQETLKKTLQSWFDIEKEDGMTR